MPLFDAGEIWQGVLYVFYLYDGVTQIFIALSVGSIGLSIFFRILR